MSVATLLESADGKTLLIRRAYHRSLFPGVWAPPGGHMEVGEQVCFIFYYFFLLLFC